MSRTTTKVLIAQEDGTVMGQCFLGHGEHLIGREGHCPIQIEADHVSREHANLIISADAIEIEDLDSTSGTYLDGVTVKGRIPIQPGQKLWISNLYIDIERQGYGGLVESSRLGNDDITMSGQWYYTEDGAQYGPVDEAEIIRLIQDGELPISTPVLQEGHMDWQPARDHACFQVEIYPKKKRPPVKAAASTTSKPASEGASQSAGQTTAQPAATPEDNRRAYWRENLTIVAILLSVWFVVSLLLSVVFVDELNDIRLGGFRLGFWIAQQGSLYTFVVLIFIYVWAMNRLDRKYGLEEENKDETTGKDDE